MKVTDEMLMALADGELEPAMATDVRRAVDADPILQRRLAAFEATRVGAKRAFADVLDEPIPERLLAALAPNRPNRLASWLGGLGAHWRPIGAALAAGAAGFVAATLLIERPSTPFLGDDAALARLLDTAASGERLAWNAGSFQATGTYVVADGVCRSFAAAPGGDTGWRGIACNRDGTWTVDIAVAEPAGAFATASDRASEAVDAYLSSIEAGSSLDLPAETALRETGWRVSAGRE